MNAAVVLADTQINTDTVTPGVLGFIVVALVAFALYLLMKSMLGKLREVRGKDFGGDADGRESADTLGPGGTTEDGATENEEKPRDNGRS